MGVKPLLFFFFSRDIVSSGKKLAIISSIPGESYKSGFPNDIIQHFPFILSGLKNPVGFSTLKSAQTKM